MPDFSQLLRKPAGTAVKPPALPGGEYSLIVKSHETGESSAKKTPYVRVVFGILGLPEDVDPADIQGIDLSRRSLSTTFYLTEDAMYRLRDFLISVGVLDQDDTEKSFEEALREAVGQQCMGTVAQRIDQNTSEVYADLKRVYAQG